jgi:protein-tyrosine phosphatase
LKLWPFRKPAAAPELRILMVCMGNICRSPTAEGMLRQKLNEAGLAERIEVDSAGTYGGHAGDPPDPRSQRHAARRGLDLSALRARQVAEDDFRRFGLILAMDEDNLEALERVRPADAPPPRLLMEFARRPGAPREVPDPYYGGPDGFERVLDLVEDACTGLVENLRRERGNFPG